MATVKLTVPYRKGHMAYDLTKLDLCVIEHALTAFENMQEESASWICYPEHVRATWQKLGRILMDCELDYDDLKEKTDD